MKHPIKKSTYALAALSILTLAALVAQVGSLAAEQTNIYLPFTLQTNRLTINGQITGPDGLPLADVQIFVSGSPANATANMPQAVHSSAVTDANGNYRLPGLLAGEYTVTPAKAGYSFAPASHQLSLPSQDSAQNFLGKVSDDDLIVNGTCEDDDGWTFPKTPHSATYSQEQEHGGNRSIRTGIATAGENVLSHSTANQIFSVPNSAPQYTLSLWIYTLSGEANNAKLPEQPSGLFDPNAALGNDIQYILVLDPETDEVIESLYWERKNDKEWQRIEFDMRNYAGMTIKLHIGTYNNGYGGVTALYADDISFNTNPVATPTPGAIMTPTPTPAPTITPTPLITTTPLPENCHNEVENFSFEDETFWEILNTAYAAEYSQEEVYYGAQAMRLGIVDARDNRASYSDVRQTISIPYTAHVDLYFWQYPVSSEPASNLFEPISLTSQWGEQAMTGDMQYVLAIDESGNQLLIYQDRTNEAEWVLRHLDLKNFAGQTIKLQFGVYNDGGGGITGMYVDNVVLMACP